MQKHVVTVKQGQNSDNGRIAWFENHVILQEIFRNLSQPCVKVARLVSPTWCHEGAKYLKITITVTPHNINDPKVEEILNFIRTHQIGHTLVLSFLLISWDYVTPLQYRGDDDGYSFNGKVYNQEIDEEVVSKIMKRISPTNNVVRDLRLEMIIRNEKDGQLFNQLFQEMTALKRLALELIDWHVEGFKYWGGSDLAPKCKIKSLGLRIHHKDQHMNNCRPPEVYLPDIGKCVEKLLKMFDTFEFLDTDGWIRKYGPQLCHYYQLCGYYTRCCLITIADSRLQNPFTFPNFNGLKYNAGLYAHLALPWIRKCKNLKDLYVVSVTNTEKIISPEIYETLVTYSESLVTFNLQYMHFEAEEGHNLSLPHLPKLKYLGVTINEAELFYGKESKWTPDLFDVFNIRQLLMSGNVAFNKLLPSLESLCITFAKFNEMSNWNKFFFWEETEAITQIKCLSISLITKCNSTFIQRLYKLFPNLHDFRHISKTSSDDEEKFYVCEHEPDFTNVKTVEFSKCRFPEWFGDDEEYWEEEMQTNLELRYKNSPCFLGHISNANYFQNRV